MRCGHLGIFQNILNRGMHSVDNTQENLNDRQAKLPKKPLFSP